MHSKIHISCESASDYKTHEFKGVLPILLVSIHPISFGMNILASETGAMPFNELVF